MNAPEIRFSEVACQQATCAAECKDNERLVNAYVLNRAGTLTNEDQRRVTFKQTAKAAVQAGKLVLVCIVMTQ
jgi:hypothetical protein